MSATAHPKSDRDFHDFFHDSFNSLVTKLKPIQMDPLRILALDHQVTRAEAPTE